MLFPRVVGHQRLKVQARSQSLERHLVLTMVATSIQLIGFTLMELLTAFAHEKPVQWTITITQLARMDRTPRQVVWQGMTFILIQMVTPWHIMRSPCLAVQVQPSGLLPEQSWVVLECQRVHIQMGQHATPAMKGIWWSMQQP
jgi:hypothetical protein